MFVVSCLVFLFGWVGVIRMNRGYEKWQREIKTTLDRQSHPSWTEHAQVMKNKVQRSEDEEVEIGDIMAGMIKADKASQDG